MTRENPKQTQGVDKTPLCLIEPAAEEQIALVMLAGARKYGARNYLKTPLRKSTYFSAMRRHLNAWAQGQEWDTDDGLETGAYGPDSKLKGTGQRHLACIGANINILLAVGDDLIDDWSKPAVIAGQRATDAVTPLLIDLAAGRVPAASAADIVRHCFTKSPEVAASAHPCSYGEACICNGGCR